MLGDLHVFDPANMTWAALPPSTAQFGHGFTSVGDRLYAFGGCSDFDGAPCDGYPPLGTVPAQTMLWTCLWSNKPAGRILLACRLNRDRPHFEARRSAIPPPQPLSPPPTRPLAGDGVGTPSPGP